jgi:8-oxo-dGTP pyrophosphatase MutT (NUDIX family)
MLAQAAEREVLEETGVMAAHRWPAHLDGRVLCADLSQPGVEVTSNRKAPDVQRVPTTGSGDLRHH